MTVARLQDDEMPAANVKNADTALQTKLSRDGRQLPSLALQQETAIHTLYKANDTLLPILAWGRPLPKNPVYIKTGSPLHPALRKSLNDAIAGMPEFHAPRFVGDKAPLRWEASDNGESAVLRIDFSQVDNRDAVWDAFIAATAQAVQTPITAPNPFAKTAQKDFLNDVKADYVQQRSLAKAQLDVPSKWKYQQYYLWDQKVNMVRARLDRLDGKAAVPKTPQVLVTVAPA